MLNKKNIAKVMAATTLLSTAAPTMIAFADVVDTNQEAEIKAIKEKVSEMFKVRYTKNLALLSDNGANKAGESVYTIQFVNPADDTPISGATFKNYSSFEKAFDAKYAELKTGETLKLKITETTHRVLESGEVVDNKEVRYVERDFDKAAQSVKNGVKTTETGVTTTAGRKVIVEEKADNTLMAKIQISDENGEERFITVQEGDVKLDLTRPIYRQVDGYYVDEDGNAIKAVTDAIERNIPNGVIDGYYASVMEDTFTDATKVTYDAIVKDEVRKITLNASELYSDAEGRLTREGNEIFKKIKAIDTSKYIVGYKKNAANTDIQNILEIKDKTTGAVIVEITVKKDTADRNGAAFNFLTGTPGNLMKVINKVILPEIETLAGEDRYKTAVEVARKNWQTLTADSKGDKAVVIVGGASDKLVDGLTATPLAMTLNNGSGAPVLITGRDTLSEDVLDYLHDVEATKVYIVGGTSAVSEEVENTLRNGLKVVRLAGEDRYETSLKVANAIETDGTIERAFLVGGNSEADALSVSAVAGAVKKPIILVPKNGMNSDIKYALKDIEKAHIIGGVDSVSDTVVRELLDMGATSAKRTSGVDRQETNAAVIKEFYGNTNTDSLVKNEVVVAKSNNAGLIDALSAGAYAADKKVPLVLATEELNISQEEQLETYLSVTGKKVEVGYGIKAAVAKFIKGLN